MMTLIQY